MSCSRNCRYECYYCDPTSRPTVISLNMTQGKSYSFFNFMLDLLMLGLTAGIWILWIIFREIRRNR